MTTDLRTCCTPAGARLRNAIALALALSAGAALAQPAVGAPSTGRGSAQVGQAPGLPAGAGLPSVQPASPGTTVPAPAAGAAGAPNFSLPNAAGLPSPFPPQLGGLPPGMPAPPAAQPQPVTPQVLQPVPNIVAPQAATGPLPSPGPGPYTPLQIVQSFQGADTNGDGQLTRAEARGLRIVPLSFEEMDRNKDGVLTRDEYENTFR